MTCAVRFGGRLNIMQHDGASGEEPEECAVCLGPMTHAVKHVQCSHRNCPECFRKLYLVSASGESSEDWDAPDDNAGALAKCPLCRACVPPRPWERR